MTDSVGDANIKTAIVAECTELAELLDGLPSTAWDTLSLCAGWRTREVVAHLTMPVRYATPRFMFELLKARGNFNRMADLCARRDAMRPANQLAAGLRDGKLHVWKPPGGGYGGALTRAVIHGLDFTVALGVGRQVPEQRIRKVLENVAKPQTVSFFGVDLDGVELKANDTDWSFGSGAPVTGQAQDLALALCGRKLPIGRLQGEAARRFTAR
jgi:uncharacterized protein (TIGR03083 family)